MQITPVKTSNLCNFAEPNEKQDSMEIEQIEPKQKRPMFLAILCILTFIGSGLTMFSNMSVYLMFDQLKNLFATHSNMVFFGNKMDFSFAFQINKLFYLFQGIFSGLALAGAFLMWNLKKSGFHLYVFAQLLLLIIPKLFISHLPFPLFQLSISLMFVYFYYKHLPFME